MNRTAKITLLVLGILLLLLGFGNICRPRYGKKFSAPKLYGNTIASVNKTMFYYSIGQS